MIKHLWGKVQHGDKRGRKLGFPTANINLHKQFSDGVYISLVKINNNWLPSLTFIGPALTFKRTEKKAECYILDFNKNLYGKWISIRLIKKTRGNKKYAGAKALVAAMKQDEQAARKYFKAN